MPRGQVTKANGGRVTRSSSVGVAPASVSTRASRRALGDVSNKRSTQSTKEGRKPESSETSEEPPPSNRPQSDNDQQPEDSNLERNGTSRARRKSLRSSSVVQSKTTTDTEIATKKRTRASSRASAAKNTSKLCTEDSKPAPSKKSKVIDLTQGDGSPQSKSASLENEPLDYSKIKLPETKNWYNDIIKTDNFGMKREDFQANQFIDGIAEYDREYESDPQEVANYVTDIYQRLYQAESETRPKPYMESQPELNSMMRAILTDWIIEVHMKFRLLPETLHNCINIIDRYLSKVAVPRKRLQLVGVTALLIACKYEEIYPPEVKDCVYITDRAYTRQDVLDMEAEIMKVLKFHVTVPTAHPFLQRYLHILKTKEIARQLANFYLERMLQEYSSLEHRPSVLAAAAVCLAINNPDYLDFEGMVAPGMPQILLKFTGFTSSQILDAAKLIEEKVGQLDTTFSRRKLVSVMRKYDTQTYNYVSSPTRYMFPRVEHINL